jgi:hypothetical protein
MDKLEPTWKGLDSAYDVEAKSAFDPLEDVYDSAKFKPRPNGFKGKSYSDTTATESQVDGKHYTKLGVQPLEATFLNFGYEGLRASIYTKVGKYLTREKGTHRKDITKAIHCLELQLEYLDRGTNK